MFMHKKALALTLAVVMVALSGCTPTSSSAPAPSTVAQPSTTPATTGTAVTVDVWHYLTSNNKNAFDAIVEEFNAGPGKELNVVVVAENQGNTSQLEQKLQNASESGVKDLPAMVQGYPDIMATLHAKGQLADLDEFLTAEQIKGYYESFVTEGSQFDDGKFRLMPIAKSTELMFYNKTRWDAIKEEIGCSDDDLATWEGIEKAGKNYYDAYKEVFFVIGSYANFFYLNGYQQGVEYIKDGKAVWHSAAAERTYNFIANGIDYGWIGVRYSGGPNEYSSNWINGGLAVCYVDSSSGTSYVEPRSSADATDIDDLGLLPYPIWGNAVNVAVIQQGGGMVITKKGDEIEQAAAAFLLYLTSTEVTARFSLATAYLPVQKAATGLPSYKAFLEGIGADGKALTDKKDINLSHALNTAIEQFDSYKMYYTPAFDGSNLVRRDVDNEVTAIVTGQHTSFASFEAAMVAAFNKANSGGR